MVMPASIGDFEANEEFLVALPPALLAADTFDAFEPADAVRTDGELVADIFTGSVFTVFWRTGVDKRRAGVVVVMFDDEGTTWTVLTTVEVLLASATIAGDVGNGD